MRPVNTYTKKPLHRRIVTLFCFLMAMSIIASVFIVIDSYSVPDWIESNDIGPVAMRIQGRDLDLALNDIRNVSYVSKASLIKTAPAFLRMDQNDYYIGSPTDPEDPVFLVEGNAYYLTSDFLRDFPSEFELVEGRYPVNSSEITIKYSDAKYWGIPIGQMMNYTHTLNGVKRTIFVVGFFQLSYDDPIKFATTDAIAIVTSEVLNQAAMQSLVYVDVDRDILSPIDPRRSLFELRDVERNIASINPTNSEYLRFYIDNYLAIGIQSYLDTLNIQRSRQVSRTQSLFLLSGMLGFLAVRFNVSLRGDEINHRAMRGASRLRILRPIMSELWILSIISAVLSLILSLFLSKTAFSSTDYLNFNWSNFADSSVLLTVDTIIIMVTIGFLLPIIGYLAQQTVRATTKKEIEHGKLARVINSVRLIHTDVIGYILIGILIFILYVGGESINSNPAVLLVASFIQIPLFLAVASIFNKGIPPLTRQLARMFRTITGKIPASVGMRGVAKNDRLVFPIILILAMMFSSCLISDTVASSLPTTHLIQTRYLIGGDLSFRLDNDESGQWNDFSTTVMQQDGVLSIALVSIGHLSLSEGLSGIIEFIAINPDQYSHTGYTYSGEKLDNSNQISLLEELDANPEGAVLTTDIAAEYNLAPGDILRVFSFGEEPTTAEFNIIGVTPAIPRPKVIGQVTSDIVIGTRKIWLNRNYVDIYANLNASAETYLCVRTSDGGNTTKIGEDALGEFETVLHSPNEWSSTSAEIEAYRSLPEYRIDRSIDSMLTISLTLCILVVFTTFQINKKRISKGENALLRSFGATPRLLLRLKIVEVFTIILISSVFVLVFTPLSLANDLRIGLQEYNPWTYTFPISIIAVVDWIGFLLVAVALLIPSSLLVVGLSMRNVYSNIADALEEMETIQAYGFTGENI